MLARCWTQSLDLSSRNWILNVGSIPMSMFALICSGAWDLADSQWISQSHNCYGSLTRNISEHLGTMMFQGMWSCDPLISTTSFIPNVGASKPVTLWYGMVWFYILNYFDNILDEHPFDTYFDVNQVIASVFIMFDPHPNRTGDHQATIFSTLPSKESSRLIGVRIKIYGAKLVW